MATPLSSVHTSSKHLSVSHTPAKITFKKVTGEDPETEKFLRIWLDDVAAIEDSGENASILKYPPMILT